MSIVVRFKPTSLTTEQYDETIRRLKDARDFPPDASALHVVPGTDGNLQVSEIWDSPQQLQAFGDRLMPILHDVGIALSAEPEIYAAHNLVTR
jgi:hypothetical protein